jgi:hypothetical protein
MAMAMNMPWFGIYILPMYGSWAIFRVVVIPVDQASPMGQSKIQRLAASAHQPLSVRAQL